jgi:inorganic phosphate transporter, PiT family
MPSPEYIVIGLVVFCALAFDFINGFHDTANAIATSVSTKALSPRTAVVIAGVLNFVGALSGTAVAKTIGGDMVKDVTLITTEVFIAALLGAIFWNLLTWWFGIPSSSSHALVGGIIGSVIAGNGIDDLKLKGLTKIVSALVISPIIGLVIGFAVMSLFFLLCRRLTPAANATVKKLQIASACLMAFSHGSNDAQKAMGIITMALMSGGFLTEMNIPLWVKIACATAMGIGTATGGWKIIKTMGGRIFKIEPINGLAADLSSSLVILTATKFGLPVSTTHVVSSVIMGVGASKRFKGVQWGIARQMLITWFLTIPASAIVAYVSYQVIRLFV